MGFKDKLGRLILSILFAGILFKGVTVFGSDEIPLTTEQIAFLTEIKRQTIEMVENQKTDSEQLRRCFAFPMVCPADISKRLPLIRKAIQQKSEEYRLLVGMARSNLTVVQGLTSVKLGLSMPRMTLATKSSTAGVPSEIQMLRETYKNDLAAIKTHFKKSSRPQTPGVYPVFPGMNIDDYEWAEEVKVANVFYELQALLVANQFPFVVYLESDRHSDGDLAKAMGKYVERIQEALNDLYDEKKNPLESFLVYEPMVRALVAKNPAHQQTLNDLFARQQPKIGVKAWLSRNSPSLKLAAFSTCSFVAAMMQAWPISIACGGTVAGLTSMQLYDDYFRMKEDFALWLVGAQSHSALRTSEARVMYSTFILFLSGQSLTSTIRGIEVGFVKALTSMPSEAAARFTSLTALREGSIRFATSSFQWKSRDLGASILAKDFVDITDPSLNTTRQQRIFTYADYLKLNSLTTYGIK